MSQRMKINQANMSHFGNVQWRSFLRSHAQSHHQTRATYPTMKRETHSRSMQLIAMIPAADTHAIYNDRGARLVPDAAGLPRVGRQDHCSHLKLAIKYEHITHHNANRCLPLIRIDTGTCPAPTETEMNDIAFSWRMFCDRNCNT